MNFSMIVIIFNNENDKNVKILLVGKNQGDLSFL